MADRSSVDSPAGEISERVVGFDLSPKDIVTMKLETIPATDESEIDEDRDHLLHIAEKYGGVPPMPTISQPAKREEDADHQSRMRFNPECAPFSEDNNKPDFCEFTRVNESGLFEIDMKKLERKVAAMTLNQIEEAETSQKEIDLQELRKKLLSYGEKQDKNRKENSEKQTEPEKSSSTREQEEEKFTTFKFERKNKLWDRKPDLRKMGREFLESKSEYCEANFTEEHRETLSRDLINCIEYDINRGVNILRRIAYPKLCEKHFSPEFSSGAFVEEDEPVEDISISVDNFEFLHKELPINFFELFESKEFKKVVFDLEKDPQINNKVPSFIRFLESGGGSQFPENCFTFILAILKNPYRKIEVFYDDKLPVVNEQVAIAEYLTSCLQIPNICENEDAYGKLTEAIIRFANTHSSFLAQILEAFNAIISNQKDEFAFQMYCKVLDVMISIGAPIIDVILPLHFEKFFPLAAKDGNCDLYFYLLKACEISISNAIEHKSQVKAEPSDEDVDLHSFYTACYNYFGQDLANRLMPIFKKYEKRRNREERFLIKKHAIYQTKYGYMDTTMRFLNNRHKYKAESESASFPKVKECPFNSAGKVSFDSSQLGYVIQGDIHELLNEDLEYWESIKDFPLSYLEDVTKKLKPGIIQPFEVC